MTNKINLRPPSLTDGLAIHQLIAECPPLDTNSSYCNFLQAGHFAATSVIAEADDSVMGFISGYRIPTAPDTLFVWQVAVSEQARGHGLASKMLLDLLTRPGNEEINRLHTTITPDNEASWSLFKALAAKLDAPLNSQVWLDQLTHFQGQHESEHLIDIGPIPRPLSPLTNGVRP